jgi:hypothetical protein
LILQGCGGDFAEWVDGFTNMLKEEQIVKDDFQFDNVLSFSNDKLTNLAFPLTSDIDMGKLAIFRLKIRENFGAMWLSDYVYNYLNEDIAI